MNSEDYSKTSYAPYFEHKEERLKLVDYLKNLKTSQNELKKEIKRLTKETETEPVAPPILNLSIKAAIITLYVAGAFFVLAILMFLPKLIFDIQWSPWDWTWASLKYGLIISVIAVVIDLIYYVAFTKPPYDEAMEKFESDKRLLEEKRSNLESLRVAFKDTVSRLNNSFGEDVTNIFGIPYNGKKQLLGMENAEEAENYLCEIGTVSCHLEAADTPEAKERLQRTLSDKKMKFFYKYSIQSESSKPVYDVYQKQYELAEKKDNIDLLRRDVISLKNEIDANQSLLECSDTLNHFEELLHDNKMEPILDKLQYTQAQSTEIFSFNSAILTSWKTKDMAQLLESAQFEYDELEHLNDGIQQVLEFVRVSAYHNIYLGVDALNLIRSRAGGSSLTTQKDMIKIDAIKLDRSKLAVKGVDINLDNVGTTVMQVGGAMLSDKDTRNFMKENPKYALAGAGLALIGAFIREAMDAREQSMENNTEAQERIVQAVQNIADGYVEAQSELFRCIELIRAIIKVNDGFMNIYEPIKQKVFSADNTEEITMKDVQQLTLALNEYNKVSKSTIK